MSLNKVEGPQDAVLTTHMLFMLMILMTTLIACVPPILCDYYESSNHDVSNCPYCGYVVATCGSI